MSNKTNIYNGAFTGLANGINICKEAVAGTIGGAGTKVIIKQPEYPYYIQTKDAFSIIQAIKCENPLEQQAVDMMKDATDSMNKIAKDGRTAMCILTDAICQETIKQGANPKQVAKEINELLPELEKAIDEQTREITVDDVEKVAITATSSERLGKLIAQVYKTQGKGCAVNHIEGSGTLEDYLVFHDGVRFKGTGYLSESFVHDEQTKKAGRKETKAIYENPTILVTKRKIMTLEDINPLLEALEQQGKKDLVIFTDDMDAGVATMLVNTHKAGIFNICIIKAPVLWKGYVFEDFAKCVGATIVEDANGITFKNLAINHLGTCERIVVDAYETLINGTADLTEWKEELKRRGDNDSKLRLHWLNSKGATIRLGATNEGELSNLRLACLDGVHSAESALESGVVEGGGKALAKVASKICKESYFLSANKFSKEDAKDISKWLDEGQPILVSDIDDIKTLPITPILSLLRKVLESPMEQIRLNGSDITGDLFEKGIVDSAQVVKNSLRNAIKIASIALETHSLVDIPKMTLEEAQIQALSANKKLY